MRVRFVGQSNGTIDEQQHTLDPTLVKQINTQIEEHHIKFLNYAQMTKEILVKHQIIATTSGNFYWPKNFQKYTRIKVPELKKLVTQSILQSHSKKMEEYANTIATRLEKLKLNVASVCDHKSYTEELVEQKKKEIKEAAAEIPNSVTQSLAGLSPVKINMTKDCVLIGNRQYDIKSRGILTSSSNASGYLTLSLPDTFLQNGNHTHQAKKHAYMPTPVQILLGSALLCGRKPDKLIVNSTNQSILDLLQKIGGDLVITLTPNQSFSRTLQGTRILIVQPTTQLHHSIRKLDEIGALLVISNPKNEIIDVNGYNILTITDHIEITNEWLIHGATPGENPIIGLPTRSSTDLIQEAIKQRVESYIAQNNWTPKDPKHTKQLRDVVNELKETHEQHKRHIPKLNKVIVEDAFKSLGYRVLRPTNRITIAYSITPSNSSVDLQSNIPTV